jgi:hypothetical protein
MEEGKRKGREGKESEREKKLEEQIISEILGSHGGEYEGGCPLGCCAV